MTWPWQRAVHGVRELLRFARQLAKRGRGPAEGFIRAATDGDLRTVLEKLEQGVPVNITDIADGSASMWMGGTALCHAASNGHASVVQALLDRGADVNQRTGMGDRGSALTLAVRGGHTAVAAQLIEARAELDVQLDSLQFPGHTALMLAASLGHADIVGLLISAGARLDVADSDGFSALALAVASNRSECEALLRAAGATADNLQSATLQRAAQTGDVETASRLLQQGVFPDSAPARGWTPLLHAVVRGDLPMANLLLEAGASVHARSPHDGVPLIHWAALGDSVEIVDAILQAGADVDALSSSEDTPLTLCARQGSLEMVRHLLDVGARVNVRGMAGRTAFEWAKELERPDILALLTSHAGDQ